MNVDAMAVLLKYVLDYTSKRPSLMQIGSTFSCLFSLHVAAQSTMSLAVHFPNGFLAAHVGNSVY